MDRGMKRAAVIGIVLLATVCADHEFQARSRQAFAQTAPVQEPVQALNYFLKRQANNEWLTSHVIGNVVTTGRETVGPIRDIVINHQGLVTGVVVEVGQLLEVGGKRVAIPFSALTIERNGIRNIERITTDYTREQFERAPEFVDVSSADQNNGHRQTDPAKKR